MLLASILTLILRRLIFKIALTIIKTRASLPEFILKTYAQNLPAMLSKVLIKFISNALSNIISNRTIFNRLE